MYLTRKDVSDAVRLAILESAETTDEGIKNFILNEMTYEQALNMVFNPMAEKFIPAPVLEQNFFDYVKVIEKAKIDLLENNRGQRRSLVSSLSEHYVLQEGYEDWLRGAGAKTAQTGAQTRDVIANTAKTAGQATRKFIDPSRSEIVKGTGAYMRGLMGDKAVDSAKGAIKAAPKVAGAGVAGPVVGGAAYLALKRRAAKKKAAQKAAAAGQQENIDEQSPLLPPKKDKSTTAHQSVNRAREAQPRPTPEPPKTSFVDKVKAAPGAVKDKAKGMSTSNKVAIGAGVAGAAGGIAGAALGYGAYKWAKGKKQARADKKASKRAAALSAAATMEAVAEQALKDNEWEFHIIALEEARKWVDRAYRFVD